MCVEPGVTIAEVLTPKQQPYLNPTVRRAIAPQALGVLSGRNLRVKKVCREDFLLRLDDE